MIWRRLHPYGLGTERRVPTAETTYGNYTSLQR